MTSNNYKLSPLVSVVIPCYNYAKYLTQAVESVGGQTYQNIEIIIINDGSTDDTDAVVHSLLLKYPTITYYNQPNIGIVKTRNFALKNTKGEYLVQLDADDYLDSNYIETLVNKAIETGADIVYADYKTFGAESKRSNFPQFSLEELKNHNYINVSCLLKVSAVSNFQFDEVLNGKTHEDWDFFLGLCTDGLVAVKASGTFLNYRIHDSGRNNRLQSRDDRREYIDVYSYVIDKHIKSDPAGFGYLSGRAFAHWYADLDDTYKIMEKEVNHRLLLAESNIYKTLLSPEYRIGTNILHPRRTARRVTGLARQVLHDNVIYTRNRLMTPNDYFIGTESSPSINKKSDLAVVVHLFYTDSWQSIIKRLRLLPDNSFDLFVTMPIGNKAFSKTIKNEYSDANILFVPNRGRDVLPFINVARLLINTGYTSSLKIHSKKSTHRDDGEEWFDDMLKKLLPTKKIVKEVVATLQGSSASIVGPSGVYYPLSINFPANGHHMNRVMRRVYPSSSSKRVHIDRVKDNYGFFGGTMMWMRLDAIKPLVYFTTSFFEKEEGQIDGTFAHAIERLLCVIPEINSKDIYEVDKNGIRKRSYRTDNIPDWSRDHLK